MQTSVQGSDGVQAGMDEAARSAATDRWNHICFHYAAPSLGGKPEEEHRSLKGAPSKREKWVKLLGLKDR